MRVFKHLSASYAYSGDYHTTIDDLAGGLTALSVKFRDILNFALHNPSVVEELI